jgi:hypothetical protein
VVSKSYHHHSHRPILHRMVPVISEKQQGSEIVRVYRVRARSGEGKKKDSKWYHPGAERGKHTISLSCTKPVLHCFRFPSLKCNALHPLHISSIQFSKASTSTHLGSYNLQFLTVCPSPFPVSINASPFGIRNNCGLLPSTMRDWIVAYEHESQSALS